MAANFFQLQNMEIRYEIYVLFGVVAGLLMGVERMRVGRCLCVQENIPYQMPPSSAFRGEPNPLSCSWHLGFR